MKKTISINELVWGSFLLWLFIAIICVTLFALYFRSIFRVLFLIFTVSYLIFILSLQFVNKIIWSKNLPLDCTRSPFGFIEIHIGKKCNNNIVTLLNACLETINIAINEEKNILIDTWLISENNMKEYFGDSVKILEPKFLQKCANYMNKQKHARNDKRKSYRYLLHVDKITDEHIRKLEYKIKKIEERATRCKEKNKKYKKELG